MKNREVIRDFISGATHGTNSSNTLGIFVNELVHYETVIARRNGSSIMVSNHNYSATTRKILALLRLEYWGFIDYVPHERLNDSEFVKREDGAKLNYNPVDPIFQL